MPVVLRFDAQVTTVELGPGARQFAATQVARQKGALQLEPDHDVQVVRRLVGLSAYETGHDVIDHASKGLERDVVQCIEERALEVRIEMAPEPIASPDEVFPQARLRLV